MNLSPHRLRQLLVVKGHGPVRGDMGNGFVIAVFFLQPVPDGQTVPQMAVSEVVPCFRFGFLNRFFLCFFLYPFGFF